ncbi:MAG: glycosyltransferase family 4 protein [Chloroflexi bacterium]|nr:glycosyltransferase family 4 protein [Chloroflexota bacterium]
MQILFLTQVLPYPLDAGPKVRAYYVLRHLARTHQVTLVSFVRSSDSPAAIAHLKSFCDHVYTVPIIRSKLKDAAFLLQSLISGEPFIIARDWAPAMAKLIAKLICGPERFDAIHADQLWMAPYALYARACARKSAGAPSPSIVLDQHNAVYMIPQRLATTEGNPLKRALLALEAHKLAHYEVQTCRQFDHVAWVTEEDYTAVQGQVAHGPAIPTAGVIPICGDPEAEPVLTRSAKAKRVTFLGGLHYPPNAQGICWFAEKIFPQVLAQVPDAILTVLGKQPPAALLSYGIPAANLEITDYIADPKPYLAETAAFVVPLLAGGGMRVKIIDGWTWGLPVVSTTVGAEGIERQADENILIADEAAEFASQVIHLLQDPGYAQQIAEAGRAWVVQHYNWHTRYQMWDQIYV